MGQEQVQPGEGLGSYVPVDVGEEPAVDGDSNSQSVDSLMADWQEDLEAFKQMEKDELWHFPPSRTRLGCPSHSTDWELSSVKQGQNIRQAWLRTLIQRAHFLRPVLRGFFPVHIFLFSWTECWKTVIPNLAHTLPLVSFSTCIGYTVTPVFVFLLTNGSCDYGSAGLNHQCWLIIWRTD